jgi:hypothetical protein
VACVQGERGDGEVSILEDLILTGRHDGGSERVAGAHHIFAPAMGVRFNVLIGLGWRRRGRPVTFLASTVQIRNQPKKNTSQSKPKI